MRYIETPSSDEKNAYLQLKSSDNILIKATGSSMYPLFIKDNFFLCRKTADLIIGDLVLIYNSKKIYIHRLVFKGKKRSITWGDNIILPHFHNSKDIIGKAIPLKNNLCYNIPGIFILLTSPFLKLLIKGYSFVIKTIKKNI